MSSIKRNLTSVYTPSPQQGFLGPDHTARAVIQRDYADSDPFILLMDDVLDKKTDDPVGGPHPHAGFETVSLLLDGEMGDADHKMKSGDFQMMTAGSGVVHTETIDKKARMRLLQLWLNLPKNSRWATPRLQDLPLEHVPTRSANGMEIKLYSGSLAGISSPVKNHVPVIIADIKVLPTTESMLELPASYTSFLYVLEGGGKIGADEQVLTKGQVGWLDRSTEDDNSELKIKTEEAGVRFVLYAGQPQGDPIVSHGPFIADTPDDIQRLYREFRQGKMKHISTVPEDQKISF